MVIDLRIEEGIKSMAEAERLERRPIQEVAIAKKYYADIGVDVRYFSALWHTFNVGHMLATDLNRICRTFSLSVADFNLMGALRIDHPREMRATDLAVTLQVSNGALTPRISRLARKGLLVRTAMPTDQRAFTLSLTTIGAATVERVHSEIVRTSSFIREIDQLDAADRATVERVMGQLHARLARHFVHAHR